MRFLFFMFLFALCGCATIFKTDKGEVPLLLPPNTSVFLKNGDSLQIKTRRDGGKFVKVNPAERDSLVFKNDTNTLTLLPRRHVEAQWSTGNRGIPFVLGFLIDEYTGNRYSYNPLYVTFSDNDYAYLLQQKQQQERYWDTLRGIFSENGVVFIYGSWGVASPVYSNPVFGNGLSGGLGVRATSWLDICGEVETAMSLDLGKFDRGGQIMRSGVTLRIHPLQFLNVRGPYINGGVAQFDTRFWETKQYIPFKQRADTIPGVHANIVGAVYGIGYSGEYWWAEWKHAIGLQTIEHPRYGSFTPAYSAFTVGLNLHF